MSDSFNFTAALLAAQEPSTRQAAEVALNAFRDSNLPAFVVGLCTELGTEEKPEKARQLAGLMLKNLTVSRNEAEKKVLEARWLTIADGVRANIRAMLMHTLASPVKAVRSTAAVVIGKLSAVEVPQGKWPELVKSLVDNCCQLSNVPLRQASFEALGFICEEIPEHLQGSSNPILNAISTGMKPEETNVAIKQAAATALRNSLEFARANFAVAGERNLIMQMVFTAAACEDVSVREVAFQCLHEIAFLYYEHLPAYMQYIFDLTANALKKEQEAVQLQAIEFWSTICDVEMDIAQEIKEAARTKASARTCNNFALGVLPSLCPLLLEQLTHQSDTLDDDTMTPAMAAGAALGVLALCTGDALVPHVLPFIQANVQSADWRLRESATLAFGAILEGPTRDKLNLLVKQAFSVLLAHLSDKNDLVKDTAAWTIGRVCHLLPETVDEAILPKLMQALLTGLGESPKVAANVCWAVHNLAQVVEADEETGTSPLSRYFEGMMHGLLTCTERSDTGEANLLGAAYEAVNSMIQSAAPDMYPLVGQLMPTLVKRLGTTLESGSSDPKVLEVQGLLCAALQCIIQRLSGDVIGPAADMLMTLFLKVTSAKSATVMEEAMLAIGALANRTGESFEKYMAHFRPILVMGLTAVKEHHLCVVSVGVVGDISRALESKLAPFCDELMTILLANLQNPEVERVVKPHIISCLGDIALAVGGFFDRYLPYVMSMLIQASKTTFDTGAFEDYEYLEKLRESILEAYTGILQGLGGDNKAELLLPHMTNIVPFLAMVSADENRTDDVTRSAVGVVGDMAARLGKSVTEVLRLPAVFALVKSGLESESKSTREAAQWAKESVEKVMS